MEELLNGICKERKGVERRMREIAWRLDSEAVKVFKGKVEPAASVNVTLTDEASPFVNSASDY